MESQEIIQTLRGKLRDYLESQGVDIDRAGFFSCIHPDHADHHPSCSLGGDLNEEVFHCFSGRGHDGNIFTAAHWLEHMPLVGKEFWDVTVKTLCERYDIPFKPIEVSEDERIAYQAYRTLSDAGRIIHSMAIDGDGLRETHVGIKHLLDRGITEASIRDFKMGVITSYNEYTDALNKLGHTDEEFLHNKGALYKSIFNEDTCILPIHDLKNRVVGFVARHVKHQPNEHGTGKYINSIASEIYTKGNILFGYNRVYKKSGPLYIVEGYLDVVYLQQAGLEKVAGIGATAMTEAHAELLSNHETDLVLCFDADKGGEDGIRLAIERLSKYAKFNISILEMPDGYDPDSYVREFGLEKFLELEKISPFYWSLKHTKYSDDLTVTANKMVPVIANEQSSIARLRMIKDLSAHTGISETDIKSDVDQLVNKVDSKYLEELRDVNQTTQLQLSRRRISDTKNIIREAKARIDVIEERHNQSKDLGLEYFNRLTQLENKIIEGAYKYGLLCPRFKKLEQTLNGVPFWGNLMYFGGRPSAGKTALMTALSLDIIEANPDCAIFYMSIDDNMDLLTTKMLAVLSGLTTTDIRNYTNLGKEKKARFQEAMSYMKGISDRYIIADVTMGNTVDVLENHVKWFCKQFPNQKKLFLLDNFHKLQMEVKGQSNKRDAISDTSSRVKDIADFNDISIGATVELRKLLHETDRPTRQDMQGSNKLDYDPNVIGLVHNDYQVNRDTRITHYGEYDGTSHKMPWIEVDIVKNKINGKSEKLVYKYNSYNMQFEQGGFGEWLELKNSMKKRTASGFGGFGGM